MMTQCPSCSAADSEVFYTGKQVPVHSVRLLRSFEEAVALPKGDIELAHCKSCGFIWNSTFRPELQDYSEEYESTQAYSPTYNSFAASLASDIIQRNGLHEKKIVEIGCGQGEFLALLCQMGNNRGTGFDPAYQPDRMQNSNKSSYQVIPDYYSEKYSDLQADFIVCKMTLEHIPDVDRFTATVRRAIDSAEKTRVFFQVPNMLRILEECAFWDVYYEHCSYFSPGSFARMFRRNRFDVQKLWLDYGEQYLMLEAVPTSQPTRATFPEEIDLAEIAGKVDGFRKQMSRVHDFWRKTIFEKTQQGKKVVLWGSGSKAVAFLTTMNFGTDTIDYTVDINPLKWNTYLAGTGQKVVSPDFLKSYPPDLIILMNPLYLDEVKIQLQQHSIQTEIAWLGLSPEA